MTSLHAANRMDVARARRARVERRRKERIDAGLKRLQRLQHQLHGIQDSLKEKDDPGPIVILSVMLAVDRAVDAVDHAAELYERSLLAPYL